MNENTLPYLGIYKIDGIDYHAFYSTYETSSNFDGKIFKFTTPIPKNIENRNKFIFKYWVNLWNITFENILIISRPYSKLTEKYYFLGTNIKARFYGSWSSSVNFNLMEMIIKNNKNSISFETNSRYNTKEYKSLERKIKIASILKETVI